MIHFSPTQTYFLDLLLSLFSIKGILFSIFLALQILDIVSTIKMLKAGAQEKNPIAQWVLNKAGNIGLVGVKVVFIIFTLLALSYIPVWVFIPIIGYYVYIVINNFKLARHN